MAKVTFWGARVGAAVVILLALGGTKDCKEAGMVAIPRLGATDAAVRETVDSVVGGGVVIETAVDFTIPEPADSFGAVTGCVTRC